MSTTGDLPGLSGNDRDGDEDDAAFDEMARRAGSALRRPAPADGMQAIVVRHRRQRAAKAAVAGGVVVAALVGVLIVSSQRDDAGRLPPADPVTPTAPAPTAPVSPAQLPTLWVELEPGSTAPLPPAPIPALNGSALVWTGTEMVVWGGWDEDGAWPPSQEGAAFDPSVGTWRRIAPSPNGVKAGSVLWTGTEMIAWSDGTPGTVSAAYRPETDTWRLIADPPAPGSVAFWIGETALVLGDPEVGSRIYGYDPVTDQWRHLADGTWRLPAVWTGTMLITVTDTDSATGTKLTGYEPATDTWRVLEGLDAGTQPVVIPGRAGAAATVAFLSGSANTPVVLLDERGTEIGELAGRPASLASTCETDPSARACIITSSNALSVGGEVLYWHLDNGWVIDLEAQTWRSLPLDGREPNWDGTGVVAAGDLLFAWGAGRDGLVYRALASGPS